MASRLTWLLAVCVLAMVAPVYRASARGQEATRAEVFAETGTAAWIPLSGGAVGQSAQDEAIWQQFEAWVAALPALAAGDSVPFRDRYVANLVQQGIAREEAERRYERILVIRHGSVDRERTYWDGAFKSGAGPDSPLRLLQETIRKLKPGRALDAGMGRGRNSIFLASVGWDTTGYDISGEALKAARASAEKAGVTIRTVQARHDTFPFGEAQWDLILCAYCYIRPEEAQWPEVFWKALRPGGLVVYQTFVETRKPVSDLVDRWRRFRVLRLEDLDAGVVDDDWTPSRTNPTIKLVARKE
jgi:SAM-dependent methyltransferase